MHVTASRPDIRRARRRRRPEGRTLDLFGLLTDEQTAAAMDDAAEAQRLMDDLVALVDAGLVVAVERDGETRYAATIDGAERGP